MLRTVFFFFFSSRRRHTRLTCDWSSDVCSSDLDPRWSRAIDAARAALPQPLKGGWRTEARGDGQKIILTLAPPAGAPDPGEMRFFANTERQIEPSAPQSLARSANGTYVLTLPVAYRLGSGVTMLDGVITSSNGFANGNTVAQAVAVDVPL